MSRIVITGGSSGLGKQLVYELSMAGHHVFNLDMKAPEEGPLFPHAYCECNLKSDASIARAAASVLATWKDPIEVLINCAGINRIGMLEDFSSRDYDDVMDTNAKAIYLTTKAFLPHLITSKGTVVNIVSNASHMPMTGSLAYNASKGAAHIMTLQLARELTRRHGITVFGLSPNKLAGTGMSDDIDQQVCKTRGWTMEEAKSYQLQSLLAGEETDPKAVAHFLTYLLQTKDRHRFLTGCILPYGA